jgi:hypothetical protein
MLRVRIEGEARRLDGKWWYSLLVVRLEVSENRG